jgi:hypothetical protein
MEITLIIIAFILTLVGIAGCIFPGLPGPPLNFAALLLMQWAIQPYSIFFLVLAGIFTAVTVVLDYLVPVWTAKKFGATKQGIWGSIIGMLIGMFFTPIGMIIGLLAGAVIGDMIAGRTSGQAVKSGFGTFLGTLLGIGIKLGVAGVMAFFVCYDIIVYFL